MLDFTKASTFDARLFKVKRDVLLGITFANAVSSEMEMRNLSLSLFSRNIIYGPKQNQY